MSPQSIDVSANTTDSAPTSSFQVSIAGQQPGQLIYLSGKSSVHGIASLSDSSGSSPVTFTIQFKSPASLGAGTYSDTIQMQGCYDQACTQQVTNSPQSISVQYTVTAVPLTLSAISPTQITAGGPGFMLTVLGTGFTKTSTVLWNASPRPTTLVSGTEIIAQIPASDTAAVGTASIAVQDPSSVAGTTSPLTLTISNPSIDAVAFQINPAHTGAVNFANISLPNSAAWTTDVGGTPSYALIADGMVVVTVQLSGANGGSSGSALIALDQTTGKTVWGPVEISGSANAAYDSGKVFVISSPFGNAATMEAFDAQTGKQLWSTLLSGQYAFTAAPTAADGLVFTGGAGSGGTLYALDQNTGASAWTQSVANGDNSTPAVTADGVYVTYPCQTYDFRPATGESIWNGNTGCEGGGGATPVVANQLVYSPNGAAGYNGQILNAEDGSSAGTYTADSPPAFTNDMGFFLQSGTLRGITLSNNTIQWSFAGDGQLAGSPIVVNQYVFIGSSSGNLYALDSATGTQVWNVTLPAAIGASVHALQFSGLSAGDGLLVVPSGTKVTAYVLSSSP